MVKHLYCLLLWVWQRLLSIHGEWCVCWPIETNNMIGKLKRTQQTLWIKTIPPWLLCLYHNVKGGVNFKALGDKGSTCGVLYLYRCHGTRDETLSVILIIVILIWVFVAHPFLPSTSSSSPVYPTNNVYLHWQWRPLNPPPPPLPPQPPCVGRGSGSVVMAVVSMRLFAVIANITAETGLMNLTVVSATSSSPQEGTFLVQHL